MLFCKSGICGLIEKCLCSALLNESANRTGLISTQTSRAHKSRGIWRWLVLISFPVLLSAKQDGLTRMRAPMGGTSGTGTSKLNTHSRMSGPGLSMLTCLQSLLMLEIDCVGILFTRPLKLKRQFVRLNQLKSMQFLALFQRTSEIRLKTQFVLLNYAAMQK